MTTTTRNRRFNLKLVWVAVAVILVGAVVAGWGVALTSWWVALPGAVLAIAGSLLARRAGIMADVRVAGPGNSLERHEDTGPGGGPSTDSISPVAAEAAHRPVVDRRDVSRLAAVVVGAAGVWLTLGHFFLNYAFSPAGQEGALRDQYLGVLILLAALPQMRSSVWLRGAWAVIVGLVVVLVAFAVFADGTRLVRANELSVAGVVLTASLAAALGRESRKR